jgi:hypothetical protein
MRVNLNDEPDSFKWRLSTTCGLTVKYMYADYMNEHMVFLENTRGKLRFH